MKVTVISALVAAGSIGFGGHDAHAAPNAEAVDLTAMARKLAQHHDCESMGDIAVRVRRLDAAYYNHVFLGDSEIAACGLELQSMSEQDQPPTTMRDRNTALALSLVPTLAGGALFGVGAAIGRDGIALEMIGSLGIMWGPSLGHLYAGKLWTPWLATRLITSAAVTGAMVIAITHDGHDILSVSENTRDFLIATSLVGAAAYSVGIVGDIVTAPAAVDARNARVQLVPAAIATTTGITPGLGLIGQF